MDEVLSRSHAPAPPARPPVSTPRQAFGRILIQQTQHCPPELKGSAKLDVTLHRLQAPEIEQRLGLTRKQYVTKCADIISQHAIHLSGTKSTQIWSDLSWIWSSANRIGALLEERLEGAESSALLALQRKMNFQAKEVSILQVPVPSKPLMYN